MIQNKPTVPGIRYLYKPYQEVIEYLKNVKISETYSQYFCKTVNQTQKYNPRKIGEKEYWGFSYCNGISKWATLDWKKYYNKFCC